MNICYKNILFCCASLLCIESAQGYNKKLVFDCGGVLFGTSKASFLWQSGPLSIPLYALTHFKNPRNSFFKKLHKIQPLTPYDTIAYDENGNRLPPIFCDWLKGVPSKTIFETINPLIRKSGAIHDIAQGIFDPYIFASTQYIYKESILFIEECINNGDEVYILSNWDAESFTLLQQRFPEFFALFSGIVISGDCGMIKPNPKIYTYLLDLYSLDPKDCVFIDDQAINIKAARDVDIYGIHVKNKWGKPNYKSIRKKYAYWRENVAPAA